MNHSHDDEIDALLRKQFDGPVADDGFSARVMQSLPPRRRPFAWQLPAGIVAGVVACWLSFPIASLARVGGGDWLGGNLSTVAILTLAAVGMAALAACWAIAEADDR